MEEEKKLSNEANEENKKHQVVYKQEKDFYKGIGGELRFKAEGLFKKAKEKGISIEEVDVNIMKEYHAEFPGIGIVDLPVLLVKVRGKHLQSGQVIADGKQIDYFNRYQKYIAEKIQRKNLLRDENGKLIKENNKPQLKENIELSISEREQFEIGKNLVEDKEFGLEKTITGGCDRVIRKLMGENDWLNPGEARLLDEEFKEVQNRIAAEQESKSEVNPLPQKKATERQINYLKAKIKNFGADPNDQFVIDEVIKHAGFESKNLNELNLADMSKIIDSVHVLIPSVKEALSSRKNGEVMNEEINQ